MPDVQAQRQFLEALYGELPEGLHYYVWVLREKIRRSRWCRSVEDGLAAIAEAPPGGHIYCGVALSATDRGPKARVRNEDAAGIVGLVSDIDIQGEAHGGAKRYPPDEAAAMAVLNAIALSPSLIVQSGNGLQAWWLLKEPWVFEGDTERAEAARIAEGWGAYVARVARGLGWDVDAVHDLARVLRVAGTDNPKTDPARPVVLRSYDEPQRYNPQDFQPYLPEMPARRAEALHLVDEADDDEAEMGLAEDAGWVDRFRGLLASDQALNAIWLREADGVEDKSASGYAFALACRLRVQHECSELELTRAVQAFYDLQRRDGDHKLHATKLRKTVERAMEAKAKSGAPTAEEREGRWTAQIAQASAERTQERPAWALTDLGNAERLVAMHGENLRYSYPLDSWYVWDGQRWKRDTTGEIQRRAVATVRSMLGEINLLPAGSEEAAALYKHAQKSEGERRIAAMITLGRGLPGIAIVPEELDADPWALNVVNGTVDLRTGALRPHRKVDLMTKMAQVKYDTAARSETWDRFLDKVTARNTELLGFIQEAAGYALTGHTGEEKLFFVHGPSRTGKTSFLEAMLAAVGDYGTTASLDAFLEQRFRASHSEELACLEGVRLVICAESRKGRRWDEERIKEITGGGTMRSRALYQESRTWVPRLKLWVASNNRPRVAWESDAMWERIVEIPFVVPIPLEERRPELKDELRDHVTVGAAVIAWAVRGCMAWQARGRLVPPEIVQTATDVYRDEMDPLGEWVAERVELVEDRWTSSRELHGDYKEWCAENQVKFPLPPKDFAGRLRALGCEPHQASNGGPRGWRGIAIRGEAQLPI